MSLKTLKTVLLSCLALAAFSVKDAVAGMPFAEQKTGVFAESFYNKTDREKETRTPGFHSHTEGFVGGFNAVATETVSLGAAYSFSKTSVTSTQDDKATMDMHTALLYGMYKPSDVFFTGNASFGWGRTKWYGRDADSKVKDDSSVAVAQMMSGYMYENSAPMYGVRYIHADDKGNFHNKADILTGVIQMQAAKTYRQGETLTFRPAVMLAVTYDFISADNTVMVLLPNGAGYAVNSRRLERLGLEAALGVTMGIAETVDVSLNYIGAARSDYQSHTFSINLAYKF